MSVVVSAAPNSQPIDVDTVKTWSVVTQDEDDALLDSLIPRAVEYVEGWTRRRLVEQTLQWRLDGGFPAWFRIPIGPLMAVTSIKYLDTSGVEQTLASDQYTVDPYFDQGRIVPAYNVTWPSTRNVINNVTVEYTAGYSATPEPIKHALLMLVDHLFEHRGAVTELRLAETPIALQNLLAPYVYPLP